MKERVGIILEHLIDSSKIQKDEDLEVCIRVIKGAIDRGCLDEVADVLLKFTEDKATERMILEN